MFFGGGGFPGGGFPGGHPGMGGMGGRGGPVDNDEYYELLKVSKSAGPDEIRKAYRKLAREHHPDKGGDEKHFQKLQEAYDILSDPEKKELYDQGGKEAVERGGGGGGQDDLFSALFGQQRSGRQSRGPQKGESVVHKLQVSLENLYVGKTFKMSVSRQRVKYPEGMSAQEASSVCKTCGGQGIVLKTQRMGPMIQQVQARCPDCGGQGKSFKDGVSVFQEKKTLEVRVDPGMKHGQKIVMAGEADENPGMEPGDVVFILVQAEHDVFQRKGADLVMEKTVSLKDALCGVKFAVKHLDERTVVVNIPQGDVIKPNELKFVAGEGMPLWKRPFEKGRLFILFKVEFPDKMEPASCKQLASALPKQTDPKIPTGEHVEEIDSPLVTTTIEDFGKIGFSADTGNAYDSDDDDERGGGGQRVQCANQ